MEKKKTIILKGIKTNNLKNINISIVENSLTVITGVSGSGKTSLAFDTLYAEGQRRYIESLSSYARQFIGKMRKPPIDKVEHIPPSIAIRQRTMNRNPRSTVGTVTEIYEYLKLLFAKIGKTYSPISNQIVNRDSVQSVADTIIEKCFGKKIYILCPIILDKEESLENKLQILLQLGYSRLFFDENLFNIEDVLQEKTKIKIQDYLLLIDRLQVKNKERETFMRLTEAIHAAFNESNGDCVIYCEKQILNFCNRFEKDGIKFLKPTENLFSFNNSYGACSKCGGTGIIEGVSEDLVITKPYLSVYDGVVNCWKGSVMGEFKDNFINQAYKKFPIHKPYNKLTNQQKQLLWQGDKKIIGINGFFDYLQTQNYKIQNRVLISRYTGKTICPQCRGTRLRKEVAYVKIGGKSLVDLLLMSIEDLVSFFDELVLDQYDTLKAERLLKEIKSRLHYLIEVGLSYLTLNRSSATLSGGESQRILLATSIGSPLVGSMYIFDEPTIGLHAKDTNRLINVLKDLRDLGNTVIVVEHDSQVMLNSDYIIDIGPMAGNKGGQVVFSGKMKDLLKTNTLTAQYLRKEFSLKINNNSIIGKEYLRIENAFANNLKYVNLSIPLNKKVVMVGVSGSGKTTLSKLFVDSLKMQLDLKIEELPKCSQIQGSLSKIKNIQVVDQSALSKSSRSNPAIYIEAFGDIRDLYASMPLAQARGNKSGYFSFNTPGGRCETCKGEGVITIQMQFLSDVTLVCEACGGKRYKQDVLDIKFKNKNIYDILCLTINEAIEFFTEDNPYCQKILKKLKVLQAVGLGYLGMGQSLSTVSGGEAQRIKLASFLVKGDKKEPTLFVFDEPTTGLHFADIDNLNICFDNLINMGHSILIVEHNLDIVLTADWIVELGPKGGKDGGKIIFEGTVPQLIRADTPTGQCIRENYNL